MPFEEIPLWTQTISSWVVAKKSLMSQFILHHGFTCSKADLSLFIFHSTGAIVLLLIYIDDIIVVGKVPHLIQSLITVLALEFAIKDLG